MLVTAAFVKAPLGAVVRLLPAAPLVDMMSAETPVAAPVGMMPWGEQLQVGTT